jgi:hypothetical protein
MEVVMLEQYFLRPTTQSTEVYAKVAIETLREVAMGDGEAL